MGKRPVKPDTRYGRLVFLKELEPRKGNRFVRCLCDCGVVWEGYLFNWKHGKTTSCGCAHHEIVSTHGKCRSPEYRIWQNILRRCFDPNNKAFPNYGGRGITVCKRWRNNFSAFLADVGPKPHPKAELDRKNNNRGYYPSNCRWSDHLENNRNTRKSKIWTIDGIEYPSMRSAASALGVSRWTIDRWCNGGRRGCSSRLRYSND